MYQLFIAAEDRKAAILPVGTKPTIILDNPVPIGEPGDIDQIRAAAEVLRVNTVHETHVYDTPVFYKR